MDLTSKHKHINTTHPFPPLISVPSMVIEGASGNLGEEEVPAGDAVASLVFFKQLCEPFHSDSVQCVHLPWSGPPDSLYQKGGPTVRKQEIRGVVAVFVVQSTKTKSCLTLCGPMNSSKPGLPVLHRLPEFAQIQVH